MESKMLRAIRSVKTSFFFVLLLLFFFLVQNQMRSFVKGGTAIVPLPAQYLGLSVRPEVVKRFLGLRLLVADLVWIDTLIKADIVHEGVDYTTLYQSFKLIFDLDPDNLFGYYIAGMYLSIIKDDSKGAIRVLRQGVSTMQKHQNMGVHWNKAWSLPFLLGFTLMFEEHEFEEGADWIRKAAAFEKAPQYVRGLAGVVEDSKEVYQSAGRILSELLSRTDREDERQRIRERLKDVMLRAELYDMNEHFRQFLRRVHSHAPKAKLFKQFLRQYPGARVKEERLILDSEGNIVFAD